MSTSSTTSYNVKVATDGTDFLAVWQASSVIVAARIDKDGKVLDNPPLTIRPSDVTVSQRNPAVAFDGTSYLVVWSDTGYNVRGAHVGRDGSLPDATSLPILVSGSSSAPLYDAPALAFDGTNFVLAYHRDTYDASLHSTAALLLGVLSPTLASVASGIATNVCMNCSSVQTTPAVAAGKGHALMGFIRPDTSAAFEMDRVRMLMFTETAVQGSPCTTAASCPTGQFCVDGVCCDTECAGGTRDCQACSVAAGAAKTGACGPVVAGQSCGAGAAAGVCASAGTCMALPPDAGNDGAMADAGSDRGSDALRTDAASDATSDVASDATSDVTSDAASDADATGNDAGGADASSRDASATDASGDRPGATDAAGHDAATTTTTPRKSGCGCATGGAAGNGGGAALATIALMAIGAARPRRRRRS